MTDEESQSGVHGPGAQQPSGAALAKMATGIDGLDSILNGGLPRGRTTVVIGGPGTGKTVMAVAVAHHCASSGIPTVLASFEERREALHLNSRSMGFDLASLEQKGMLFVVDVRPALDAISVGTFDIGGFLAIVEGKVRELSAEMVVVDAVDVVLRMFEDSKHEQRELERLLGWIASRSVSSLLTARRAFQSGSASSQHFLEFASDCLIRLDQRLLEQVNTRRLQVIKYRGSGYGSHEYPYIIGGNGFRLLPLGETCPTHSLGEVMQSGDETLDVLLGGGFRRRANILISGPSGVGKTTLLSVFAAAACRRSERVLFVSFEESQSSLLSNMESAGVRLRSHVDAGLLHVESRTPESMNVESHLVELIDLIAEHGHDHLILDAVSACQRMGSVQMMYDFLIRLSSVARVKGLSVLVSNQTTGFTSMDHMGNVGISSLIDTSVLLRYVEAGSEMKRVILVSKARGMAHSNQYHEFSITKHGISILNPLAPAGANGQAEGGARGFCGSEEGA